MTVAAAFAAVALSRSSSSSSSSTPTSHYDGMPCDDPLAASYTISRINPAFADESLLLSSLPRQQQQPVGDGGLRDDTQTRHSSSGYDSSHSRSSSATSSSRHSLAAAAPRTDKALVDARLDGVRQLSEGVSRSPTLLAVRRALEGLQHQQQGVHVPGGKAGIGRHRISTMMMTTTTVPKAAALVAAVDDDDNKQEQQQQQAVSGYRCYSAAWTECYLGSGIVPGDITLKAKGYEQVLDLTLDADGAARLVQLVEHGTRRRCCCRAVTALLAAALFLAAIVAVSLVVSRGQRVFGAL